MNIAHDGRLRRLGGRTRRFARAFRRDPRGAIDALVEEVAKRRDRPGDLVADDRWNEHFHSILGVPWPCPDLPLVEPIWTAIAAELEQHGIAFGRHTYGEYSDGDLALAMAAWCAVLHVQPNVVVETGVAHGVSSRIILEALNRTGHGHLWSVDQPHLFDASLHVQTGVAVPSELNTRWTYLRGSSRRRLPPLLRSVGHLGLFIHDSLHTSRNTLFEMRRAFSALSPGGVMLIDDITTHQGFSRFLEQSSGGRALICRSTDGLGHFGIVCKDRK